MARSEVITSAVPVTPFELAPGVELRVLVSGELGARGLSTGTATFRPGAELPYHRHPFSEAVTVLSGAAVVLVQGRRYRLTAYDSMHVPAGTPHLVRNAGGGAAVLHSSFASANPTREAVGADFPVVDREGTDAACPEHLTRFADAQAYELSARAVFRDLFAGRFGAKGICGGYGRFEPGASLPCHTHGFDESITIVEGVATCQVAGQEYALSDCDTACIPEGRPHRFLNRSAAAMAMVWVYAGDEPDRTLLDPGFCDGSLPLQQLGPRGQGR